MKNIELNIFTNAVSSAPQTRLIEKTYNSFVSTFGKIEKTNIWYNPYPNVIDAVKYRKNLKKIFNNKVIKTQSFSDGYIKSIKKSTSDFMFMLEHDWIFNNNINHSLDEIIDEMIENDLWYIRFNKRKNETIKKENWMKSANFKKVPFCYTNTISNNPHIINRKKYIKIALDKIKKDEKSYGIEENLTNKGLNVGIYGTLNYERTIIHLNGKRKKWQLIK